MGSFITTAVSALQGLLLVGLLGVGLLIALVVLRAVAGAVRRKTFTFGSTFGLARYHGDTVFSRKISLKTRQLVCKTPDCSEVHENVQLPASKLPVAVLRFDGDVTASDRDRLARQIDEVIINSTRLSSAVVIVSSPGGGVAQYGQLYAEMERLRKAIHLTVCVDTVAASGGYLMSLPAHKIIAAPFATVGSIGVVAEVPNYRKLMEKIGIEGRVFTAGKHKRTVTTTGDDSPEALEHFRAQLEAIHKQFIASVTKYRKIDADKVCTGDHWTAEQSVAQGLNLVDEVGTSHDFLLRLNSDRDLIFFYSSEMFARRVGGFAAELCERLFNRFSSRLNGDLR